MSVVSVNVKVGGRSSTTNEKGVTKYTREYIVLTNSQGDDENVVAADVRLPQKGDAFSLNPNAIVKDVEVRQRAGSKTVWDVTVTWSTDVTKAELGAQGLNGKPKFDPDAENPSERSDEVDFYGVRIKKPVLRAIENAPVFGAFIPLENRDFSFATEGDVLNSAGVAYDPVPEDEFFHTTIRVVRFENSTINIAETLSYRNSINQTELTIGGLVVKQWTGLMTKVDISSRKQENGYDYVTITFEMEIAPEGWDLILLDQGFHEIPSGGTWGDAKKIILSDGEEPMEPVLLDGNGGKSSTGSPKWGHYRTKKEKDWGALQFPDSLFD